MTGDLDLLHGRNEAQRWQAIVSQFNAALAIQQELQRSIYEEKFDQIRRDNERTLNEIKNERAVLDNLLCEALDNIDDLNDKLAMINKEEEELENQRESLKQGEQQLKRLGLQLQEKLRVLANESETKERQAVEELDMLDIEKRKLRDEIRDLKGFINMQSRLNSVAPDAQGQSFITAPKVKSRSKHFYFTCVKKFRHDRSWESSCSRHGLVA